MGRRGPSDVAADRQRVLFGADKLERLCADMASEVVALKLCIDTLQYGDTHTDVSRETLHLTRIKQWLVDYENTQRAEWNLSREQLEGVANGKKTK